MSALLVPAAQVLFWSTRTTSASPIASSTFVPVQVGTPTFSPNFNNPTSSGPLPTDGGGQGFSPPAVLWIVFCVLVGPPLITAGVRGWKVTSGVGNGLALAILCQYLAFRSTHTDHAMLHTYSLCELHQHNGGERPH